jgi:aminoglycoside phosphotransferase (APT) family kinase protein
VIAGESGAVARAAERALETSVRGAERLARGYSNVTWIIETDVRRYLLKIPPRGAARVARTVEATAAALDAGVPTPRIVHHDVSGTFLSPFWIQEYVEDAEDAERLWPALAASEREAVARAYGEAVARLHATPYAVDGRRPLSELVGERFAARIGEALELGEIDAPAAQRLRQAADAGVALLRGVEPRLCHTDLYLENVLLTRGAEGWRFAALLDFEAGRASDPAEDFVKLRWWNFEPHPEIVLPFHEGYDGAVAARSSSPGRPNPARQSAAFQARISLFCLLLVVASLGYFRRRSEEIDSVRPWKREEDRRQLALFRGRFECWLADGVAC